MRPALLILALLFSGRIHAQWPLLVESNYDDAEIAIDGKPTEVRTPGRVSIKPGRHKITLTYRDILNRSTYVAEDCVTVASGTDRARIDFKPISVTLVCNAEHTRIFLSGRLKGEGTDLVLDRIIPGTYNLRLQQPYGLQAEKEVYFPPNSSDCPPECFVFGNLLVTSEEIDDAMVYINGIKSNRRIPALFNHLIIGEYQVGLETNDGKMFTRPVIIQSGKDAKISIDPSTIRAEKKAVEVLKRNLALEIEEQKKAHEKQIAQDIEDRKKAERQGQIELARSKRGQTFVELTFGVDMEIKNFDDFKSLSIGIAAPVQLSNSIYLVPETGFQRRYFERTFNAKNSLICAGISTRFYLFDPLQDVYMDCGLSAQLRILNKKIQGTNYRLPGLEEYLFFEFGYEVIEAVFVRIRYNHGLNYPGPKELSFEKRNQFIGLHFSHQL